MWHYSVIQDIINEQTERSRELNREPCTIQAALDSYEITGRLKIIPFLGTYTHDKWEETEETFFVDHTGYGHEYEPALTITQFISRLKTLDPADGLGIVEQGAFQSVVRLYRRK